MADARPEARLTVVASPSGVGRRRVVEFVRARLPAVWSPVPVTSRAPQDQEQDGVQRRFVGRAEFLRMRRAGELLEWAEFGGVGFGTARGSVEAALRTGRPVLLTLDIDGARQVRQAMPGARLVLLIPAGTTPVEPEFDITVVNDSVVRAADELVGLLGSPALL